MKIQEALKFLNENSENEFIKMYKLALDSITDFEKENKEEFELYKSSKKYDYFIEIPKKRIEYKEGNYRILNNGYSVIGMSKINNSSINFCLSYCNYSKEHIIKLIEAHIVQDNKEEAL